MNKWSLMIITTVFFRLRDVDAFFRSANLKKGKFKFTVGHVNKVDEVADAGDCNITATCVSQTITNAATR